MPDIYLFIVVLLFLTAISDLIVGVANDAVNFLNSAIGSKVAPRHIIMIIASVGLVLGALSASGMMEIARKGIFNPDFFTFAEVIAIFLAVMMTDIILLDFFNTFGLPTSTTVSIVFELLGAGMVLGVVKSMEAGQGFGVVSDYINTSSALTIITSIFLSVGLAFSVGMIIMYVSRLLFTYQYEQRLKWLGGIWSGLALTVMSYFLLIKGLKGATFIPGSFTAWVSQNTALMLLGMLVFWSVLMQVLLSVFRVNILRLIVLFGTFGLAMAFAANDLVNFIGVPMAGYESYRAWVASGQAPGDFSMSILRGDFPSNPLFLAIAGGIMIVTLWTSKKARTVTETEVNLGRQHEGLERFSPNWLSQIIVRGVRGLGNGVQTVMPKNLLEKAESNFKPADTKPTAAGAQPDQPAFDLVRASVNLTVASALIALGTSLKLPLSTTYVTFMVAMGTSLADRAWGRDSAVYRVAGVINVIGGWFATAFIAFTVCGTFAFLIYQFGLIAIIGLIALAIFFFSRTFLIHKKREESKARMESAMISSNSAAVDANQLIGQTTANITATIQGVREVYAKSLQGLANEKLSIFKECKQLIQSLRQQNEEFKFAFYANIGRAQEQDGLGSRAYLLLYDLEQDLLQSAEHIARACKEHVKNSHEPLHKTQEKHLSNIQEELDLYLNKLGKLIQSQDFSNYDALLTEKKNLLIEIERMLNTQVEGIKKKTYNARNSLLFFSVLLETKDLAAIAARFGKLYYRLHNNSTEELFTLVTELRESGKKKKESKAGGTPE